MMIILLNEHQDINIMIFKTIAFTFLRNGNYLSDAWVGIYLNKMLALLPTAPPLVQIT